MRLLVAIFLVFAGLSLAQTGLINPNAIPNRIEPNPSIGGLPPATQYTNQAPWEVALTAWQWTGNTLTQACAFTQGTPIDLGQVLNLGFSVPIPFAIRPQPELDWICEAASLWRTINSYAFQDWARTAGEIAGQWLGDIATGFLTAMGIEVGSATWAQSINNLNQTLRQSYRNFREKVYNLMWDQISASLNKMRAEKYGQRNRPTDTTPQNQFYESINNLFQKFGDPAVNAIAVAATTAEAGKQADIAAVTGQTSTQNEYLKQGKTAAGDIVKMLGKYEPSKDPITEQEISPGVIKDLQNQASSAPSSREVLEVLVKATTENIRATLYSTSNIAKILDAQLNTQAITNSLLVSQLQTKGEEITGGERIAREALSDLAADAAAQAYNIKLVEGAFNGMLDAVTKVGGSP